MAKDSSRLIPLLCLLRAFDRSRAAPYKSQLDLFFGVAARSRSREAQIGRIFLIEFSTELFSPLFLGRFVYVWMCMTQLDHRCLFLLFAVSKQVHFYVNQTSFFGRASIKQLKKSLPTRERIRFAIAKRLDAAGWSGAGVCFVFVY